MPGSCDRLVGRRELDELVFVLGVGKIGRPVAWVAGPSDADLGNDLKIPNGTA